MAARADKVSRVDHDGVTLVEGATSDVRFAFTERAGGVSEDAYSSLNLGSHVGDDPFAVQENRRRALGEGKANIGCRALHQRNSIMVDTRNFVRTCCHTKAS